MKKITRSHKPLILITNDDGIQAKGIREVADFLKPLGDILIVAPDAPRSGQSSAITVTSPLRMKVVEERDGFLAIRTNGTPVDCIKLSMNILLDERPDLIVSGINHGSNSGVSVIYSGTMTLCGSTNLRAFELGHIGNIDIKSYVLGPVVMGQCFLAYVQNEFPTV